VKINSFNTAYFIIHTEMWAAQHAAMFLDSLDLCLLYIVKVGFKSF